MVWRAASGADSTTSGHTSGPQPSPTTSPSSPASSRPDSRLPPHRSRGRLSPDRSPRSNFPLFAADPTLATARPIKVALQTASFITTEPDSTNKTIGLWTGTRLEELLL